MCVVRLAGLHRLPSAGPRESESPGHTSPDLTIDGENVPFDQITTVDPLSQIFFRSGEGKVIRRFEPGTHRAAVTYWPRQESEENAGASFTWTFRVD